MTIQQAEVWFRRYLQAQGQPREVVHLLDAAMRKVTRFKGEQVQELATRLGVELGLTAQSLRCLSSLGLLSRLREVIVKARKKGVQP